MTARLSSYRSFTTSERTEFNAGPEFVHMHGNLHVRCSMRSGQQLLMLSVTAYGPSRRKSMSAPMSAIEGKPDVLDTRETTRLNHCRHCRPGYSSKCLARAA